MNNNDSAGHRLGYIHLQAGVSRFNGLTLLYLGLTGIPFMAFINFIQPIVLELTLGIPRDSQGAMTANLAVLQEVILLCLVGPFGALSDRLGRRPVIVFGYLVIALGFTAYPWAGSPLILALIRGVYAIGAAALVASYSTLLADYPQERSRGKLVALLGVMNGLGIGVLGYVGGNLPKWLEASGFEALVASRLALALVAGLCVLSAIISLFGLRGARTGKEHKRQSLARLLAEGLSAGRNPRVAVAYASAFAARGDVVVIGTYISLWISQAGIAKGLSPAEAQGQAGMQFGIVAVASLLAAPLLGILNDGVNRVAALMIGMGMAAFGYLLFGFRTDPLSDYAIAAALILGVGQIGAILAGQTLISQEADSPIAGSIIGVFSFFGAIGTLVGSWVGGQLFGLWRPGAPFILMGVLNLLVGIAALILYLRERRGPQFDAGPQRSASIDP